MEEEKISDALIEKKIDKKSMNKVNLPVKEGCKNKIVYLKIFNDALGDYEVKRFILLKSNSIKKL